MNIVVCGGRQQADYLLSVFANKRGNRIVVINDDEKIADTISEHYGLDVIKTDPTKKYSFEIADVNNFDLVISLQSSDADNFVTCKMAKQFFHIKKAICTVSNPNNVDIFMKLGIDVAISDSYLLTQKIKGESDIESIFKTSSLEGEKFVRQLVPKYFIIRTGWLYGEGKNFVKKFLFLALFFFQTDSGSIDSICRPFQSVQA